MISEDEANQKLKQVSPVVDNPENMKQIIKTCAQTGICPECGEQLIVTNLKWSLIGPREKNATVKCPNHHDLDYNSRTGTSPEPAMYTDMNLHKLQNGIWRDTYHSQIKKHWREIKIWLSD